MCVEMRMGRKSLQFYIKAIEKVLDDKETFRTGRRYGSQGGDSK